MNELNEEWENFCDDGLHESTIDHVHTQNLPSNVPKCSDIYISTKTKIGFLSKPIDLYKTFWQLPIIPYHLPKPGIVKKQMKFNSKSEKELQETIKHIDTNIFHEHHIINRIVNPEGRISYKDVRKISIGLCKKDITSYRCKKKGAFYNCFAVILRIYIDNNFKEVHVKVFNTGKLEIPGIQNDNILETTLNLLCKMINNSCNENITWDQSKIDTVLINSNFRCGYYIDRNKLYEILKFQYRINSAFDPCSYPGIQCEFYYNLDSDIQTGQQPIKGNLDRYSKISFMIFRTGSVLIAGKCHDLTLNNIYLFIKNLLEKEYLNIKSQMPPSNCNLSKIKKIRKKTITLYK